jgi:cytochrome c-type biogenesis protein CcmH
MMLWVIFGALALATAALLVVPLLRRAGDPLARSAFDLQVYREQLVELQRDQERGVLAADQAEAARTEIHRRILAAEEQDGAAAAKPRLQLPLALLLGLGLPLIAAVIYSRLGSPDLPDRPFAARQADPAFKMTALLEQLAAHLQTQPDGDGYRRLGQGYMTLQRYSDAADAFKAAEALGVHDSAMSSAWGEALTMSQGGMVGPEARHQFLQSLAGDAQNPQARFYIGLGYAQIGEFKKAVAIWRDLEKDSAADAPWLPALRQHIAEAGKQGAFDPVSVSPAPPEIPTGPAANPGAAAAIASMAPEQRDATIRSMVAGLATRLKDQPNDFDGWMRLTMSYKVLGETDKAKDAAAHAIKLKPQAVEPRLALAQIQMGDAPEDKLPADFLANLREILALEPDNVTALYYLGAAAAAGGHAPEARKYWEKLLTKMPADQPERAEIKQRLDALK